MSACTLSTRERDEVIDALLETVNANYVFPDMAARIEAEIQRQRQDGAYEKCQSGRALALLLTRHLQSINPDQHLGVSWHREPLSNDLDATARMEQAEARSRRANFGLSRLEIHPGNVGYINIRGFGQPEKGGGTLVGAMAFLAHVDALIVDLRECGGGYGGMVRLACSYFFDEPTHLNDFYWRPDDSTIQSWTMPHVPGRKLPGIPIYILTSGFTFSAGEEFAYDLQALDRALIVGEATGGGAHPGERFILADHFDAFIPCGRAINPITGGNWEGEGVQPDVATPAEDALPVAQRLALTEIIERAEQAASPIDRNAIAEAKEALAGLPTT